MAVRKLRKSWQYDFKLPDHPRQRRGGYRTRAEALQAERRKREEVLSGSERVLLADAFNRFMSGKGRKERTQDSYVSLWGSIKPQLGHLYMDEIDTARLDRFKQTLKSQPNHHLRLIKAILRFMWKRGELKYVPYVPMERTAKKASKWYTEEERDQFLGGVHRWYPQWYLFFYLTCRLGLRRGEVYALSHRQILWNQSQLVIDQQVQQGTKSRPTKIVTRKNNEAYSLDVSADVLDAIRWHIEEGYAGKEFLFSADGIFPKYLDGYKRALRVTQQRLGLRKLSHHQIGRHSVGSQAATSGESIRGIQAQLGHRSEQSTLKYMHLAHKEQFRVLEGLKPRFLPHRGSTDLRVNVVSTGVGAGQSEVA